MKNEDKRRYKKKIKRTKDIKKKKKRNLLIFKFLNDVIIVSSIVYIFGIISFNFIFIILIIFY